jgi:hypothetical protein
VSQDLDEPSRTQCVLSDAPIHGVALCYSCCTCGWTLGKFLCLPPWRAGDLRQQTTSVCPSRICRRALPLGDALIANLTTNDCRDSPGENELHALHTDLETHHTKVTALVKSALSACSRSIISANRSIKETIEAVELISSTCRDSNTLSEHPQSHHYRKRRFFKTRLALTTS